MGELISLLIIIGVIASIAKGANKTAQKRPGQPGRSPGARPGQSPDGRPQSAQAPRPARMEDLPPEIRNVLGMDTAKTSAPRSKQTAPPIAPSHEGMSRTEPDGCVGGSLPHPDAPDTAGPRPRVKSTARAKIAPAAAPAPDVPTAQAARGAARLYARDLRAAVVMAEVLARPVALRPRVHRRL